MYITSIVLDTILTHASQGCIIVLICTDHVELESKTDERKVLNSNKLQIHAILLILCRLGKVE